MTDRTLHPAQRLADLLREVRQAKPDARDFALFERRDALAELGVPHHVIDGFDATDDAALDGHIAQARAAAAQDNTTVASGRPPIGKMGGLLGGLERIDEAVRGAAGRAWNGLATPRWAPVAYEKLPPSYDYSDLNRQFDQAMKDGAGAHREVFHAVVQRPSGRWDMTARGLGTADQGDASAMDSPFVKGAHHTHDNGGVDARIGKVNIDPRTGEPYSGGAVSGGDAAGLIKSGALFSIAQAGKDQTMFVRIDRTPKLGRDGRERLKTDHNAAIQRYYDQGESWADATLHSAKDTATRYGLGLYKGEGGIIKRVPLENGAAKRR